MGLPIMVRSIGIGSFFRRTNRKRGLGRQHTWNSLRLRQYCRLAAVGYRIAVLKSRPKGKDDGCIRKTFAHCARPSVIHEYVSVHIRYSDAEIPQNDNSTK